MVRPGASIGPRHLRRLSWKAFREAVPRLEKLAAAAKPGLSEASSVRDLAVAWATLRKMHAIHSRHEEDVIFPCLETFFPKQVRTACILHATVAAFP